MNALKLARSFRFNVVCNAKTADGWARAAVCWLSLSFAAGALYLAAMLCIRLTPFLAESDVAAALYRTAGAFLAVFAIISPPFYAATFRLRAWRGLRGNIAAIAIYAPIFGAAIGASLVASSLFGGVDDALSRSSIAGWASLALAMGPAASALTALAVRVGKPLAPPPAITANRFYTMAEIAVSIAALVGVVAVSFLAA